MRPVLAESQSLLLVSLCLANFSCCTKQSSTCSLGNTILLQTVEGGIMFWNNASSAASSSAYPSPKSWVVAWLIHPLRALRLVGGTLQSAMLLYCFLGTAFVSYSGTSGKMVGTASSASAGCARSISMTSQLMICLNVLWTWWSSKWCEHTSFVTHLIASLNIPHPLLQVNGVRWSSRRDFTHNLELP